MCASQSKTSAEWLILCCTFNFTSMCRLEQSGKTIPFSNEHFQTQSLAGRPDI